MVTVSQNANNNLVCAWLSAFMKLTPVATIIFYGNGAIVKAVPFPVMLIIGRFLRLRRNGQFFYRREHASSVADCQALT